MVRMSPNQWPADGSLPTHVAEYVEWVIDPDRNPRTVAEWARANGFDKQTCYRWRSDKRVKDAIEKRAAELNINPERTQDVVNAIWRAAEKGDMKAAALYLQYIDRLTPKRVIIQDERIEKLSDDELHEEMVKLGLVPKLDDVQISTTEIPAQFPSALRPVSFAIEEEEE